MKLKKKNILAIAILTVAGLFGTASAVVNQKVNEEPIAEKAEAATTSTVYFAISNSDIGSGKKIRLKIYMNEKWEYESWYDSSDTGKTYYGKKILSYTFTDKWDGIGFLQFVKCNSDNSIDSYLDNPFGPAWTTPSVYSGKMWVHNESGWKTYSYDTNPTYTLYIDATNWSSIGNNIPYCHYWNEGLYASYSDISGSNITSVSGGGTYSNKKWWAFTISPYRDDSLTFLFAYNNYDMQTANISFSANNTVYYVSGTKSATPESSFTSDGIIYKVVKNKKLASASATTLGTDYVLGGESYQTQSLPGAVTGYNTPTQWSTNADGTGTKYTPGDDWINNISSNKTLYAYYSAKTMTVTLNRQSGTGGSSSITATYASAMPSITLPTRNGYDFGGYFTSTGGGGTKYYNADGSSAKNWDKTSGTTLYAYWTAATYTITVNLDGGEGVSNSSYTFSTSAQTVTLDAPTKEGKDFAGYIVTTQPTSGTITVAGDNVTLNIPANTYGNFAVTAQWSDGTYTITYNANGGSTSAPSSQNPGVGVAVTLATYSGTKTGYTFTGWNTNSSGTGAHYDAGGEYTPSVAKDGTLALFAEWTVNSHTLTWDFNGGTATGYSPASGSVNYGTAITKPSSITKTGYTLSSWDGYVATMPDEDLTITANWSANTYTVSLDNQSATTAGATSVTATYDSDMPSIAANLPAKTGYTFGGYYSATGGSGTQYIKADGTSARTWNIADDTILYAKWTINTYTITYDRNQGDGSAQATQPKNYGENVNALTPGSDPLTASAWNASQYHYFSHWNTEYDDSDITINAGGTISSNEDFTLYYIEKWYEYRYTINGGSPVYMTADSSASGALRQFAPASAQELPLHGILNFQVNRHDGNGWVDISVNYESGGNYNTTTGIQLATNDTIFLKLCENEVYNVWVPGISERTIMITNASGSTPYSMKGNGDAECVTVGYVYATKGDMLQAEYKGGGYKVWLDTGSTGFENTGDSYAESSGVRCTESGAYTVYLKKGDGEWHNVWIARDEQASAKHYAQQFNTALSTICEGVVSGTKDLDDIQDAWGTSSTGLYGDFVNYSTETKKYFTGATSTSDADILACIAKYNYIENKYGTTALPNFMGRTDSYKAAISSFSPFSLFTDDEDNLSTIIIIAASGVALLSVTALSILVIKKRKNKEE